MRMCSLIINLLHPELLHESENMEPSFEKYLISNSVGKSAVKALATEGIVSKHIFKSLKEEHMIRLLKCSGMTIGSHALLWELWDTASSGKLI